MNGFFSYLITLFLMAGIFAILSLGLNLQWGFTGLFNVGISGFFAIGAYATAILTKYSDPEHLGGFNFPILIGLLGAMIISGIIAFLIGFPVLKLKDDYLAVVTLGIAESIRLIFTNESFANGNRGIKDIPKPWQSLASSNYYNLLFLLLVIIFIAAIYIIIERTIHSPWGRILKAIREDELLTASVGKNVFRYKMESLVIGSMFMGLAGGLYAHYISYISPDVFQPMQFTFLVWIMLIIGGRGNNLGAILGAFVIWAIWSGTEFFPDCINYIVSKSDNQNSFYPFIDFYRSHNGPLRIIAISIILELILIFRPDGIMGEVKKKF